MEIDVEKIASIVAKDGPSLGMFNEGEPSAVGVLFFRPRDLDAVKAFFPTLSGAK